MKSLKIFSALMIAFATSCNYPDSALKERFDDDAKKEFKTKYGMEVVGKPVAPVVVTGKGEMQKVFRLKAANGDVYFGQFRENNDGTIESKIKAEKEAMIFRGYLN